MGADDTGFLQAGDPAGGAVESPYFFVPMGHDNPYRDIGQNQVVIADKVPQVPFGRQKFLGGPVRLLGNGFVDFSITTRQFLPHPRIGGQIAAEGGDDQEEGDLEEVGGVEDHPFAGQLVLQEKVDEARGETHRALS